MKPVKGFEGVFSVCETGVVYRTASVKKGKIVKLEKPKPLRGTLERGKYVVVFLRHNGKSKHFRLSNLVWETFKGPLKPFESIKHIDGDNTNNRLYNLYLYYSKESEIKFNKKLTK